MVENDNRLLKVEEQLKRQEEIMKSQGKKLDKIQITLNTLAVQNERISTLETQCGALWKKFDALVDPSAGTITEIRQWQASCPRNQIKLLWAVIIPMGLVLIELAFKVLTKF